MKCTKGDSAVISLDKRVKGGVSLLYSKSDFRIHGKLRIVNIEKQQS